MEAFQPAITPDALEPSPLRLLVAQYTANEAKVAQLFKGNKFYVTGTITDIKEGLSAEICSTLQGDGKLHEEQCFFNDEDSTADFRKGQQVTFKETCAGLSPVSCNLKPNLHTEGMEVHHFKRFSNRVMDRIIGAIAQ